VRYAALAGVGLLSSGLQELDTGGPKRAPERRGRKGPPKEALTPEGGGAGETRREWPSLLGTK
jgi:hypothetical protein